MRSIAVVALSLVCLSCKTSDPSPDSPATTKAERAKQTTTATPETATPVDGFFLAAAAPNPHACEVASDCMGDTIPDLDQPCCQNPQTLEPYARAYRNWLNDWRAQHCDDVTCPPPPAPSRPPDCAFKVDCVAGVCVDSCPDR